jgi:hypothetical protein
MADNAILDVENRHSGIPVLREAASQAAELASHLGSDPPLKTWLVVPTLVLR